MRRHYLYFFIGLVCAWSVVNSSILLSKTIVSGTWGGKSGEYVAGEILVKVKKGADLNQIDQLLSANGAFILRNFDSSRWGIVGCDAGANIFEKMENFVDNTLIEWAEPNMRLYPARLPNDSFFVAYQYQVWLHNTGQYGEPRDVDLDAPEAWDIETGSASCTVAVLDTGIPLDENDSLTHEDLNDTSKFILGINTADSTASLNDLDGHGTDVIGIIGAMTNNDSTGVAGICWGCRILVVKIGNNYQWTSQTCGDGIRYAYRHGAKIINISGGTPDTSWSSLYLEDIVAEADSAGALIVASAGNHGPFHWPAGFASWGRRPGHENGYRNVIAVSAVSRTDTICTYSSYSNDSLKTTVSAFGCSPWTTAHYASNGYEWFGGT